MTPCAEEHYFSGYGSISSAEEKIWGSGKKVKTGGKPAGRHSCQHSRSCSECCTEGSESGVGEDYGDHGDDDKGQENKQTSSEKNNGDNYLIVIGNNLIERRIVKGGRHVTK